MDLFIQKEMKPLNLSGAFQSSCCRHSGRFSRVSQPPLLSGLGLAAGPPESQSTQGDSRPPSSGLPTGRCSQGSETEGPLAASSPICTGQHWPPLLSAAEAHCAGPNQPHQALAVRLWACSCPRATICFCCYVIFGCVEWHAGSWP